ncbi:hypothetical protein Btru_009882 [Bulinus truncatus]|nr:hypothetical protein Btru_009882 [Bulinus truncatus]
MFSPSGNHSNRPLSEDKKTTKLKINLADLAWQHVTRSPDTRYSSLGSPPLADSSLPPISKMSFHSSGNQHSEPSTPSRFMISLGLSKSQNSLTRLSSNESGESVGNSQIRQRRQPDKVAGHNTISSPNVKSPQVGGRYTTNGRAVADVTVNPLAKPPWESARSSPVISADNINNRIIKFLAADNTLRSSPSRRNKLMTFPDNALLTKSMAGARRTSHSPIMPTASTPQDKLTRALSHSPAPKNLPLVKIFQPKIKNRVFFKDNGHHVSKQKSAERSVSIRRKIEQYRKKYDEQYTDKLKRLKLDGDHENGYNGTIPSTLSGIDFTQILEARIHQNVTDDEKMSHIERQQHVAGSKNGSGLTNGKKENRVLMTSSVLRPTSGASWRTWRDVNESDAYNDVTKYIRDNDLMDAERERWIQSWLRDVQTAMLNMDDVT